MAQGRDIETPQPRSKTMPKVHHGAPSIHTLDEQSGINVGSLRVEFLVFAEQSCSNDERSGTCQVDFVF